MATILLGLTLAGCAISPKNGNGQYTQLVFTVYLNGNIQITNPLVPNQYEYAIVMDLAQGGTSPPLTSSSVGIAPAGATSVNGFVTGNATNALIISNVANTTNPVSIYDLGSTPQDSGGVPFNAPIGTTIDYLPPPDGNGDIPGVLTFTVTLDQLQPVYPRSFQWIQFQVLTMNKTALSGTNGRVYDALGMSPNFQETPWVSIATSQQYQGLPLYSGLTGHTTPVPGDPALSIQSVSLQVSVP